jgi:hypothetical protein
MVGYGATRLTHPTGSDTSRPCRRQFGELAQFGKSIGPAGTLLMRRGQEQIGRQEAKDPLCIPVPALIREFETALRMLLEQTHWYAHSTPTSA